MGMVHHRAYPIRCTRRHLSTQKKPGRCSFDRLPAGRGTARKHCASASRIRCQLSATQRLHLRRCGFKMGPFSIRAGVKCSPRVTLKAYHLCLLHLQHFLLPGVGHDSFDPKLRAHSIALQHALAKSNYTLALLIAVQAVIGHRSESCRLHHILHLLACRHAHWPHGDNIS